jgi:hypothetical protein
MTHYHMTHTTQPLGFHTTSTESCIYTAITDHVTWISDKMKGIFLGIAFAVSRAVPFSPSALQDFQHR